MRRPDLIEVIQSRLNTDKKTAEAAVNAVLDTIQLAVAAGERVAITGFGVFERIDRAARTGRNPRTGEVVRVKKTSVPRFRPGTQFKGVVRGTIKLGKVADAPSTAVAKTAPASSRSTSASDSANVRRASAKTVAAKKVAAKKAPAKRAAAKKVAAKKTVAKKIAAKKAPAKKTRA